jgi:hypothetical protein
MEGYYVTVIRNKRVGWLAGPFDCVEDAERRKSLCRRIASDIDPWTDFDAFGVTRLVIEGGGNLPEGKLQSHVDHYEVYGVVNW